MKKETREKQIEKMIYAGMQNLYSSQDELDLDKFSTMVLETLILLDRGRKIPEKPRRRI